jgi:putative N6-adenine-specific DNA methylase
MKNIRLVATTAFGIESVAANEIKELGYENISTENGRVIFDSDLIGLAKANLWIRSADRIYILLDTFQALSFESLFDQVNAIPWENYIDVTGKFPVNAKSVKSKLFSLSDIQKISKKAIVKRLSSHYDVSWFEETGSDHGIVVSILKDKVSVLMDASGEALHKRGYRAKGNIAPLKETLAAALVLISRWKSDIRLVDPLCGSGTILIEAALIGRNIAPGLNRKFASEYWHWIPDEVYKQVRKQAYEVIDFDREMQLEGYDHDRRAIWFARENAELAGVDDIIHFQERDVASFSTNKKYGYIITNPPYGERIGETESVRALYRTMGEVFRPLETWSKYFITSMETFETDFGQKSTKNRKLYNGRIKTYYYQYYGKRPPKQVKE